MEGIDIGTKRAKRERQGGRRDIRTEATRKETCGYEGISI